jgi:hypothetical protein
MIVNHFEILKLFFTRSVLLGLLLRLVLFYREGQSLRNSPLKNPCYNFFNLGGYMNFRNFSDDALEKEGIETYAIETGAKTKLLHILAEVERRRMYSKRGIPNLHTYCLKVFKIQGGSAQRRIDTMHAMKLIPDIEEKILSGDLNITVVSQAEHFFRREEKNGKKYSVQARKELFEKLENKSTREVERELVKISPQSVTQERIKELTEELAELKIVVNREFLEVEEKLRGLWSHRDPKMTHADLILMAMKECLKRSDPAQKKTRKILLPAPEKKPNPRYIPPQVRKAVWIRDQGKCTFEGCSSRFLVQHDHIIPVAMGGKSTVENLRLRCHAHNQRAAIEKFGFAKIDAYINKT